MTQRVEVTYGRSEQFDISESVSESKKERAEHQIPAVAQSAIVTIGAFLTLGAVLWHRLGNEDLSQRAYNASMAIGLVATSISCLFVCHEIYQIRESSSEIKVAYFIRSSCMCVATICMLVSAILVLKSS